MGIFLLEGPIEKTTHTLNKLFNDKYTKMTNVDYTFITAKPTQLEIIKQSLPSSQMNELSFTRRSIPTMDDFCEQHPEENVLVIKDLSYECTNRRKFIEEFARLMEKYENLQVILLINRVIELGMYVVTNPNLIKWVFLHRTERPETYFRYWYHPERRRTVSNNDHYKEFTILLKSVISEDKAFVIKNK
jgi:thiol-disulfide isomerase/thioredoxin